MHPYRTYARHSVPKLVDFVQELVECESPSDSPADVNRLVSLIAERTRDIAKAKTFRAEGYGSHLLLEFRTHGRKKDGQILGLGHSDTVWPMGTLKHMPFRRMGGRLHGPGILDMKGGLALFIYAVRLLAEHEIAVERRIKLLIVSDEEVGSVTSRAITEAEARGSDCVFVLEPGTGLTGKLKTARKGVGRYTLDIDGKASHAGVDFERGASAILEAARQVEKLAALTDLKRGVTVNPGVIRGGTRSNVVAAAAHVEIDARVTTNKQAAALDRKLRALRPVDKRCKIRVDGGMNRPPMERSKQIASLFRRACEAGAQMGMTLEESSTGGGSDGNFTAALGVPTLDGLGAVGEGAHAANECVLVGHLADRMALLAALLSNLQES